MDGTLMVEVAGMTKEPLTEVDTVEDMKMEVIRDGRLLTAGYSKSKLVDGIKGETNMKEQDTEEPRKEMREDGTSRLEDLKVDTQDMKARTEALMEDMVLQKEDMVDRKADTVHQMEAMVDLKENMGVNPKEDMVDPKEDMVDLKIPMVGLKEDFLQQTVAMVLNLSQLEVGRQDTPITTKAKM